jgi:hypothetical protein
VAKEGGQRSSSIWATRYHKQNDEVIMSWSLSTSSCCFGQAFNLLCCVEGDRTVPFGGVDGVSSSEATHDIILFYVQAMKLFCVGIDILGGEKLQGKSK